MARLQIVDALLFVLLFSSICFAFCPSAQRGIYLAAVTGEDSGGVFQLTVETRPGNGTIYTSVSPRTGFATQESEEAAVEYAFASTGFDRKSCDVLFRMSGDFGANSVDGPSAGGAMAVATRAALLGKGIRQDVVMTGTISSEGKVGEVGGVIEKSLAAEEAGAKYFLVPRLKVHEALLISSASSGKNFRAMEVSTAQDAEKILFSGYSEEFASKFNPESKSAPKGLQPIPIDADIGRFTLVSKNVVDELDLKVKDAFSQLPANSESQPLRSYFSQEISKYYSLLPMGYAFTAANAAFLLSIDAEYVKMGGAKIDLGGSIREVKACASALEKPAKTRENFHWAVGSDLRRLWAQQKLNQTQENRQAQDGYTSLRDLLFAHSWCRISGELARQAGDIGGEPSDESALSQLANDRIMEAEETLLSSPRLDYDASWHLDNAYVANESGEFGAAIYEAAYAKTMQEMATAPVENLSEAAGKLAWAGRTSLWGKIYFGQGKYLYSEALEGKLAPTDAYRILKYSSELDRAAAEIDRELLKKKGEIGQKAPLPQAEEAKAPTALDLALAVALSACVAAFGLAVVYRLARKNRAG